MKLFSQRDRRMLVTLGSILALLLVCWILFAPYGGAWRYYRLQREHAGLERENDRLRQQNQALQHELDQLTNDPAYLEKVARKEYGMLKDDEVIYRFPKGK